MENSVVRYILKRVHSLVLLLYAKRRSCLYCALSTNIVREVCHYLRPSSRHLIDLQGCSMRTYDFMHEQWSRVTPLHRSVSVEWSRWVYLDWNRSVFACGGEC